MYGDEEALGPVQVKDGRLVRDLGSFAPKAFGLTVRAAPVRARAPVSQPVPLPFDVDVVSCDETPQNKDMEGHGCSLPAELLPKTLTCEGIQFALGPGEEGRKNAVACAGQRIRLLEGTGHTRLYLLAAATEDTRGRFRAGDAER